MKEAKHAQIKKIVISIGIVLCLNFAIGLFLNGTMQRALTPNPATNWGSSDRTVDEWPMEGGQLNRTRAVVTPSPVYNTTNNGLVWTSSAAGSLAVSTIPIISGSFVYYSGSEGSNFYVYCISASTGNFVWRSVAFDYDYFTSPTLAGGSIFVGVQGPSVTARMICIDAATGATNWSQNLNTEVIEGAPVVSGGRVFFTSRLYNSGSGTYAANLTSLDATTGTKQWSIMRNNSNGITPPAVVGNYLFAGNDNNMSRYSVLDGSSSWNSTLGGLVTSAAVVLSDVFYCAGSTVYCVSTSDGSMQWSRACGSGTLTAPAATNNFVYVGSTDANVYCLNAVSGNLVWSNTTNAPITAPPTVGNDFLYVRNFGDYSKLYSLNALTGFLNWSYDCHRSTGYSQDTSPSLAQGYVFQALGGQILCLPMIYTQPAATTLNNPTGIPGYPLYLLVALGIFTIGISIRKRKFES